MKDTLFVIFVMFLAFGLASLPFFSHRAMVDTKNRYQEIGYECVSGHKTTGPTHTRHVLFKCTNGTAKVTVGLWGRIT
mgnify:FL=1